MSMGMGRFVPMRGPTGSMLHNRPWAEPLYDDRGFARAMTRRWRQVRAGGLREWLLGRLDAYEVELAAAALGPAEAVALGGHVVALESWLARRIAWMDRNVARLGR